MRVVLLISAFFILNLAVSCGENNKEKNPCKDVVCGEYGACKVEGESFTCECKRGFRNTSTPQTACVKYDLSPLCKDTYCGDFGDCVVENYKPRCKCDEAYHNETSELTSTCIENEPCYGVVCGDEGTCVVENDTANCKCNEGYHNQNSEATSLCINSDPCKDVSCGDEGTCIADTLNGVAGCDCNEGYHNESELHDSICVKDRLKKEDFRLACTKMLECGFAGEEDLDLCITKYYSYYYSVAGGINAYYTPVGDSVADYANCVNTGNKTECSDFRACYDVYVGIIYSDEACDTTARVCDGDITLKSCDNGKYKYKDCSSYGKKCLAKTETSASCTNDVLCDSDTFKNYCNDAGSLVYCSNGVTKEYYCPFFGKECKSQGGASSCQGEGNTTSCENNLETKCENGDMIQCRNNIQTTTSCVGLYGEGFTCMSFSYSIADGSLNKNTYGCFYE